MTRPPVLSVRVHEVDREPSLTSVCPGYEAGRWRSEELARDVFDRHLINFALHYSDASKVSSATAAADLRRAARTLYDTDKYKKRGEFGELLIHAVACDVFDSTPAISKIFFKDGPNETVKGFDLFHVVEAGEDLELWLGEVKFYQNLSRAIREVVEELRIHLDSHYLRGEFVAILNKLDDSWPHSRRVARMLDENVSLDEIFDRITIPVLLTYDSTAVAANSRVSTEYIEALREEAMHAWRSFASKCASTWNVTLRLILMPLESKDALVDIMHKKLEIWRQI
jgi:8-oxo-dGTP pyrophosphatase MutT (NUDIX family)